LAKREEERIVRFAEQKRVVEVFVISKAEAERISKVSKAAD